MEPLHAVFDSYKLDEIDRTWINQVCESNFANIENVPVDYHIFLESSDMIDLLGETCRVVKNWISDNHEIRVNGRYEVSWETLVAMNVEIQALLCVIAYLMRKGQSFDSSQDSRQCCLRATSLYLVLLSIPGSNAFQAFQPALYEICLKSLELSQRLTPSLDKSFDTSSSCETFDNRTNDDGENCDNDLSRSQILTLTQGLNGVMYDLVIMLKYARTTMEIRSLEITIYYLVEMTKLADETIIPLRTNDATTSSLAYNAYVAMEQICNSKYAPVGVIARIIAKYALPQFLVTATNNISYKRMTIVRESTMYFFKNLLVTHDSNARSALVILLQYAMIKFPEKLDGRQRQAAIVVKLFHLCCGDEITLKRCVKDLVRMSHHSKIACRIFAQEIIGKFILELSLSRSRRADESNCNDETLQIFASCNIEEILLSSALGRCVDSSSMVRGRAIATIAEYTDSIDRPAVRKIFKISRDNDTTREIPSLEIIEESINTNNANLLIPNIDETMAMLVERLEDERALVRRSALQVIRNGINVEPELLNKALPLICKRCRDSIITVRRYAIKVLTSLLEKFPDTPGLAENWVNSVLPRIFDSETKVQEDVFESLAKLTIDSIKNYTKNENVSNLPWTILDVIANNKMGDHLSRACSFWLDDDRINETKINFVKTHLETRNNAGSWLMLASISENKSLTGMKSYYLSYGQSLVKMANNDIYLASLSLRVLKNSWSTFDDTTLKLIAQDLENYLLNYNLDVSLIRHCMEILLDVTRHLASFYDETTLTEEQRDYRLIARRLVDTAETTIFRIVIDESLENTENLLFRAICTLGHASFFSWSGITRETRRTLQRFLLDWNSLPDGVRDRRELQGAAVTVLGQQSLIDRDIAVEMTPIFGRLLRNSEKNSKPQDIDITQPRDSFDSLDIESTRRNCVNSPQQNGNVSSLENINTRTNDDMANGPVVRINAAKALADICVRFTSLVEPYLTDMCVSMKDPDPEVRQVILVIFIQLLVEDTIMIKDEFFYHIMTMLADDNETIRQMTIFLIKERLLAKNKNLITQQFLNGIYHFNDYDRRNVATKRRRGKNNYGALSLAGDKNMKKRRIIYDFMLENLDPPGKLMIYVKITRHVLNPRSNDYLDVCSEKGISVLRDAIYVVSSDKLQANLTSTRQNIDDDNSNNNGVDEASCSTANSVINDAIKKHRNEYLLPCLAEMRKICGQKKSPFYEEIAKYLANTIADTGKEALTFLYNEYPKLEREMQRDIRKYSKRSRENSTENDDDDDEEINYRDTTKKSNLEGHSSLLINPNRMPRIVLRRLSTLTYPGNIDGCSTRLSDTRLENSRSDDDARKNTGVSKSDRKNRSRR